LPLSKGKHLYFGIVVVVVGRGRKTRGQSDTYPLKYLLYDEEYSPLFRLHFKLLQIKFPRRDFFRRGVKRKFLKRERKKKQLKNIIPFPHKVYKPLLFYLFPPSSCVSHTQRERERKKEVYKKKG
jgi:hypothetical protein